MAEAEKKHSAGAGKLVLVVIAMFGFGFALIPLYDVFCEITGLNGKTGRELEADVTAQYQIDEDRLVTVQFVAHNSGNMPWDFGPQVKKMQVHPGKVYETSYLARNGTSADMVGQAVPSVVPIKAARYFNKTECFCFDNQPLKAGEQTDMPLRFVVDPALPKGIKNIVLSYTFFDVTNSAAAQAAVSKN